MKITVFWNIFDTTDPLYVDVIEILKRLKDGNSKDIIEKIRSIEDKDQQQQVKKRLPSICFSGRFSQRKAEYLLEHSGLICLDIDELKEKDLHDIKEAICEDEHVFACFVSPSGYGLKVIVKIHPDKAEHKSQFLALEHEFNQLLSRWGAKIDRSGKDVGRVCYESWDPEMFYNEDSEIWIECRDEEREMQEVTDPDAIIQKLQTWIDKDASYHKGERNNYLIKFAYALCRYGVSEMRALAYLQENFSDFPFSELKTLVAGAYKKEDFHSQHFTEAEMRSRITKVKGGKEKEVTAFWSINDRGRVVIDPKQFLNFISANGFGIYRQQEGGSVWQFVHVSNMIVDVVDVMDIKKHILDYVEAHAPEPVFAELQMKNRYFEKTFLNALPILDVQQIKDESDKSFVFFESYFFEITKDTINKHDYVDLKGRHIWRSQMSKKNLTEIRDFESHDFNQFVRRATGEDQKKYDQARAALGYLMHTYKKRRLTKLVYACDESAGELDGMADGGTGKNLFFESLKFIRSVVDLDGKDFDKRDKFKFQTIQDDTQIVNIDDYEGDIKELFTRVTGHFEIEKKGQDKVIIAFDDAPKMMISSNTSPSGFSSSFARRLHLVEFSDHYSNEHTPADEFGDRDFFSDDWGQRDYDCLYSFLFSCLQEYFKTGLTAHVVSNQNREKTLIKNVGADFADFIEGYDISFWTNGRKVLEEYMSHTGDQLTSQKFYSKLRKYCALYKHDFEQKGRGIEKEIRIIKEGESATIIETIDGEPLPF